MATNISYLTQALRLGALAGLLVAAFAVTAPSAVAASTGMVDLGTASTYAVLSGASVGNTVSAPATPHTTLRGDLGVKANTQPTGFPPGVVTGAIDVGDAAASQAHADVVAAYNEVAGRTGGAMLAGALAGTTIPPGLHTITGAVSNTATVTLDGEGDPNAVFVFQVGGAMAMAAGSHVVLTRGAQASRVFWQVNGAGAIGANADFAGTLMALDAVAVGNQSVVNGRAFARNGALTLDANEFYSAPPVVTIAGGATAITTDTTPTISGTTDVEPPAVVTVTINGQNLIATRFGSTWSVTSAILANNAYPVVASVSDGAGNPGRATQLLTVDTVAPVVTIDGGPSVTTNDRTPTMAGTSDVAPGTVIRVTVDAQTLTALVQLGGWWNVTPAPLADATRTVTASVTDPAGNEDTDSQVLTVDTSAPAATIAGGAHALTNDPTPGIAGTADVAAGTTVTVTLADETLTAPVTASGAWSVTAADLADGPHRVVMSVFDAAGNEGSFTQTLTVDTVSPVVLITSASAATTSGGDPTIAGTCDAAPGTTVTVAVAGQTLTTLVQPSGTWNATPTLVGEGAWLVVASAPDPAGNVGSATQTLTIAADRTSPSGATSQTVTPALAPSMAPTAVTDRGRPLNLAARSTVTRGASQKVKGTTLSIGTKVTAPAEGPVVATASGTVRVTGAHTTIGLTRVTATIPAGHSATLRLRPKGGTRAAKAALLKIKRATRKGVKVSATITVRLVDADGNTREVTRTVKLTK
jgi:hypothetical protein